MIEIRHLKKAPITEALIDIRAKLHNDFDIHIFDNLNEEALDEFRFKERQKEFSAAFKVEKEKPSLKTKSEGVRGYIYKTGDKKNIVQFRRDGFTFNRLKPYTRWEDIISTSKKLWDIYAKYSKPFKVTRIATRYINHIKLPLPIKDFSLYMTAPPNNPAKNDAISSYLNRIKIIDPVQEIGVNITQTLEKGTEKEIITFLLDIDAFINKNYDSVDPEIWIQFEKLRNKKNSVFFSSLTEETINMFL